MPRRAKYAKDRPIAGNERDGKLWSTGEPRRYVGDRRVAGGKFETRWFDGARDKVMDEWRQWVADGLREADMVITRVPPRQPRQQEHGKEAGMAQQQQTRHEAPKVMFVITYRGQRSSKSIALYASEDSALRMATALTAALEVTGVDGEYDVNELPVWE